MNLPIYFVIRPSPRLLELLVPYGDTDIAPILKEAELWDKTYIERSAYFKSDYILQIKLLFLMNLREHYSNSEIYQALFGGAPPITLEDFDAWWSLELYDLDESGDEVENTVSVEVIDAVEATEFPLLNEWLAIVRENRINNPYPYQYNFPNIKTPKPHNRPKYQRKLPRNFPE